MELRGPTGLLVEDNRAAVMDATWGGGLQRPPELKGLRAPRRTPPDQDVEAVKSRSRSSGSKEGFGSSDAEPAAPAMSAQPIRASLRADVEHFRGFKNQSKRGNYL